MAHHQASNQTATEWAQGHWVDALLQPFTQLMGAPLVGVVLGGALILGFYIHSGDIALPSVVLLLLGGILLPVLPGAMVGLARAFIVVAMAGGFMALARRYVL